jgi:WD40 repeat protein
VRLFFVTLAVLAGHIAAWAQASAPSAPTSAHSEKTFPPPDVVLRDTPHKEPKSGVQLGASGLTIKQGVATPTAINSLSFSANGKMLAAGKDFGRVVLWEIPARKFLRSIDTGQRIVSAVALSPDSKILATGGADKIKPWDLATNKLVNTIEADDYIHSLTFDHSGKWLAFADNGGTYVVEATTAKKVLSLATSHAAMFGQDGNTFMTSDKDGLSVLSTTDWSKIRRVPLGQPYPYLLAVHTASDRSAVYRRWRLQLLHLSTGEPIPERADALPEDSTGYPKFTEFSTDGSVLFASVGGRLWAWDLRTNAVCGTPVMYSGSGALSPDNRWLGGAKDDSILSTERTDGVWIWDTSRLLAACGMSALSGR